ncbi:DUF2075 domain-containing protein [Pseudomonas nitroreducens]|uniref:DNA 3'-5' helicase II n=1 Tax=Pseudomonas nitroreducens TaxID=46680 RepID=A0A5R9AJT8_PSENT|nr:AAA family ATPase [Pseudomonas nitroreducens]TLP78710.1 DUF2075 domain-containing protein [Pseudomonas nitroreducens]
MAIIYPQIAAAETPDSELKVRDSFSRTRDFVVFHSLRWQSQRGRRQGDGEADFIIIAPAHGILVLEVKGGGVEVVDGQWITTDRYKRKHKIKDPFQQAADSKYALLAYLSKNAPSLSSIPLVHAVAFPDVQIKGSLSINSPRKIIMDLDDLKDPDNAVKKVFHHWGKSYSLSKEELSSLVEELAPTTMVSKTLREEIVEIEKRLVILTEEQIRVLNTLNRVKRALIVGGAGTGKSLLAVEKAKKLSESGLKTLLLCYNTPLKERLAKALEGAEVSVQTFHSLAIKIANAGAGRKNANFLNEAWFEKQAPEVVLKSASEGGLHYDAVIVDEAQDFSVEWLSAVEALLKESGHFYLFADSHQNLYKREWRSPENLVELELSINCRNTKQIADQVAKVFGDQVEGPAVFGPMPEFVEIDSIDRLDVRVSEVVMNLLEREKLSPENITVLTDSANLVKVLRESGVGPYLYTTLNGVGIAVETVHKFKGLESDAVVLAVTNKSSADNLSELAYVGYSRAKASLHVIGESSLKDSLFWIS